MRKSESEKKSQISLVLPTSLLKKLDEKAAKDRRTRKDTIIIFLENALKYDLSYGERLKASDIFDPYKKVDAKQ